MRIIAINTQAVTAETRCGRPIMSTFHGMFSLGAAVAGLLATRLSLLPLHVHMLCVGGLSIIASLSAANGLAEQDSATSSHDSQSGGFLPPPSLRMIAVVLFCAFLVEGALAEWSTKFMREEVKASLSLAPLGLAGFSLGMLVGRFVGDRCRQRCSASRLVLCGSLLSGLASLLALVVPVPLAVSFLLLLSGLGLSILAPVAFSAAASGSPSVRTEVALSQLTSVGYTAFMLGPALIGALSERFGLRYALFLLPGLMGVSALLGVWTGKRSHAISIDRIT